MGLDRVERDLEQIFGADSRGSTPFERARTSRRLFVRSQDLLAPYSPPATGRVLSAWEALEAYGLESLAEAVSEGSYVLTPATSEPAASIRRRRESLGLSWSKVAQSTGLNLSEVQASEDPARRVPIRDLERIAEALALDERLIGFEEGSGGDAKLAVRLRAIGNERPSFTQRAVLGFDEAAWVVAAETRLRSWLRPEGSAVRQRFSPSPQYGDRFYPAYRHGQFLARKAREVLGLNFDQPVANLKDLCDQVLAIPLVQSELPENFAGATIANGNARGILVNVAGRNENVWVRRTTIAHELGHLLWDPDQRLNSLRVDDYIDIERDALFGGTDYVEQRANAFAVEFLAPQAAVEAEFRKYGDASSGVAGVMQHFGVSFTVARFQIWNALGRKIDFDELHTSQLKPSDEWNGKESFTVDFFPIDSTPISRRGAFAGIVVAAEGKGLISADTAQSYLVCSAAEYKSEASFIAELFPFWSVKG